ncbi:MAG: c-type cytochrome [Caldilineaceae bacterium]|nr:c-type cytochrome [Caldilineaceae bacterium]
MVGSQPLRRPLITPQRLLLSLIRLGSLLALLGIAILFAQQWRSTLPVAPVELRLRAYLPINGGWVNAEPLRVESGQPVRLHLSAVEGAHALHIAHTDITSAIISPGSPQVLEFNAPAPGRYVLACTLWCGLDHWRMRTVLEVIDPTDPHAPLQYVQDEPRYTLPMEQLMIDDPHPADVWPEGPAHAADGEVLWGVLTGDADPAAILDEAGWPLRSPSEVYQLLERGDLLADADTISAQDRWALLAFLWEMKIGEDALARGESIYTQECASCHGVDGSGNGFESARSPAIEPDLRLAPSAAGASPAQYYAKIARGGMGTGMPNWGTFLSETELWAVTGYLYKFLFDDPVDGEIPASEHQH